MIQTFERSISRPGSRETSGTWIQITFTLDSEHYRMLWEKAEKESRTVPALVRDTVIKSLQPSNSRFTSNDSNRARVTQRDE